MENLRIELINIEHRIKEIAGNDVYNLHKLRMDKATQCTLNSLLNQRQNILNEMFFGDFSEMACFRQVNNMLTKLTTDLFNRIKALSTSHEYFADKTFDSEYELEGTIKIVVDSQSSLLRLDNDEYYGSDFLLMNSIITEFHRTQNENIEWFVGKGVEGEDKPWCDDGVSWNEYPFYGHKEFDDILICHAVHDICSHKMYSIPDLLRLNDYWAEVKLTLQKFVSQSL